MSATLASDAPLASPSHAPPLPEVLQATGGLFLLGLCLGLGGDAPMHAVRAAPAAVLLATAPFVLTTPALLVVHALLRLRAPVDAVVGAVAQAVVRAGRLALGLTPTALFFAATTDLALAGWILGGAALGAWCVATAAAGLHRAERDAGADLVQLGAAQALIAGWSLLTLAIGLRIAADATTFAWSWS